MCVWRSRWEYRDGGDGGEMEARCSDVGGGWGLSRLVIGEDMMERYV